MPSDFSIIGVYDQYLGYSVLKQSVCTERFVRRLSQDTRASNGRVAGGGGGWGGGVCVWGGGNNSNNTLLLPI